MKYFTKEWYKDTIVAEMCFQMNSSRKASVFSEKYFESLYRDQKKYFIKDRKRIAKYSNTPFDASAAELEFEANYRENTDFVKENIPAEILEKVADLRVLALGTVEYDILQEITRYCGRVHRRCEKVSDEYDAAVEQLAETLGWEKINLLNRLANSAVITAEGDSEDFVFATSAEYTGVPCRVKLIGAKSVTIEDGLIGSMLAQFEILPADEGMLSFSALCLKEDGSLVEFSAEMKDLEVR
jgi:hypothetical protein